MIPNGKPDLQSGAEIKKRTLQAQKHNMVSHLYKMALCSVSFKGRSEDLGDGGVGGWSGGLVQNFPAEVQGITVKQYYNNDERRITWEGLNVSDVCKNSSVLQQLVQSCPIFQS